jgi:hypothetical protein
VAHALGESAAARELCGDLDALREAALLGERLRERPRLRLRERHQLTGSCRGPASQHATTEAQLATVQLAAAEAKL